MLILRAGNERGERPIQLSWALQQFMLSVYLVPYPNLAYIRIK